MRKLLLTATALLPVVLGSAPQAQERWPEEYWNPKPLAEDLILPMPCGGAMAFRPVPTPIGQGLLADRPAMLGQADAETNAQSDCGKYDANGQQERHQDKSCMETRSMKV